MALTRTARGQGTNTTAANSFTLNAASNLTAGALAVLCISADNNSSGGATNNISSVTDSIGNRWFPKQLSIFDNGTAAAGVQGGIFTTDQSVGPIQTGTTITVTFGTSTTAKTWTLQEVTAATGFQPLVVTGAAAAGQAATTAPSVTTGTIAVGDLVIAMVAIEAGTTQTFTDDTDTTNGSWTASQYAEIGTTTSGSVIGSQTKIQTTTASTQTFNPTIAVSSDVICSWIQVREVAAKKLSLCGIG